MVGRNFEEKLWVTRFVRKISIYQILFGHFTIKNTYLWRNLCKRQEKKFFFNKSTSTSELTRFCHLRNSGRKFMKNNDNNPANVKFLFYISFVSLCFLFINWWNFTNQWQVIDWWISFSLNINRWWEKKLSDWWIFSLNIKWSWKKKLSDWWNFTNRWHVSDWWNTFSLNIKWWWKKN